jgi:hypothetical protein
MTQQIFIKKRGTMLYKESPHPWKVVILKQISFEIKEYIKYQPILSEHLPPNNTMATNETANGTPESEFLYHVKRTITDFAADKSGATRTTDILGTFTDLTAAKRAARECLASEGYISDDFEKLEVKEGTEDWKHDDGVLVFAKAPAGQEFEVRLDTKPNTLHFKGNESGEVEGFLHYGKTIRSI